MWRRKREKMEDGDSDEREGDGAFEESKKVQRLTSGGGEGSGYRMKRMLKEIEKEMQDIKKVERGQVRQDVEKVQISTSRGEGGNEDEMERLLREIKEIAREMQEVKKDVKGQGKEVREALAKMKEERGRKVEKGQGKNRGESKTAGRLEELGKEEKREGKQLRVKKGRLKNWRKESENWR